MKSSRPNTSDAHQTLLVDLQSVKRSRPQKDKPHAQAEKAEDAELAAFFEPDPFEKAFADAEAMSKMMRPVGAHATPLNAPRVWVPARVQQKRPMRAPPLLWATPLLHRAGWLDDVHGYPPDLRALAGPCDAARFETLPDDAPMAASIEAPLERNRAVAAPQAFDAAMQTLFQARWARVQHDNNASAQRRRGSSETWPPKARL